MASVAPGRLAARLPALPAAPTGPSAMWIAGVLLALSNFMVVLDTSIANVSVPHIAGSLAISPDEGTWVITSYSVAEAICVPLTGWLASRYGSIRTYLVALVGFGIFSVLCGLSESLAMLVLCRIGQGFCGGPIMPLTQTLMLRVFGVERRGQATGLWAMTTVVAPIAGPLLGGAISDNWSWHWIFFINIPVAITCVVGAAVMLQGKETETVRRPIDTVGLALLFTWVGSLQLMLDLGRDRDWFGSSFIVALAIIAAIGFCAFLIWELTEEHPAVDLRIFRYRGFSAAVTALAVTFGIYFASVVVTPQWLQGMLGYTASWSGAVTAWSGLFAVILSPIMGKAVQKIDPRMIVSVGICWLAGTMLLRAQWTTGVDYWTLALPHVLTGIGMAMFFVPITIISLGAVSPAETASAAGLSSFLRTLSAAVGTSIASTVWANEAQRDRVQLSGLVNTGPGGLAQPGLTREQTRGMLEMLVNQQSFVLSLDRLFQIAAVLLVFSAALVWLAPKPGRAAGAAAASAH